MSLFRTSAAFILAPFLTFSLINGIVFTPIHLLAMFFLAVIVVAPSIIFYAIMYNVYLYIIEKKQYTKLYQYGFLSAVLAFSCSAPLVFFHGMRGYPIIFLYYGLVFGIIYWFIEKFNFQNFHNLITGIIICSIPLAILHFSVSIKYTAIDRTTELLSIKQTPQGSCASKYSQDCANKNWYFGIQNENEKYINHYPISSKPECNVGSQTTINSTATFVDRLNDSVYSYSIESCDNGV